MKVIIAGTRWISDYKIVKETIERSGLNITEVVSGGCKGPDKLGEKWAEENGIKITRFPADWDKHGKAAGPIRNTKMIDYVGSKGGLILVWDGKSKGSSDILDKAISWGLRVYERIVK